MFGIPTDVALNRFSQQCTVYHSYVFIVIYMEICFSVTEKYLHQFYIGYMFRMILALGMHLQL